MAVTIGGTDGGSFTKKKNFKIKDGDNVYRILPSLGFGGKTPNGKPFQFYNVHFGYKNSEGKMRVFQSPEVKNRETKMVEREDAAKIRIEKLKSELEKAKASKNKAMVDKLMPLIGGQKPMYNMDNNHHCNAINQQGEIGILKLRHRAKLALDAVIKSLRSKGVEPLGAEQGRYFVINRTGMGLDTTFTVTVLKRIVTIEGQEFEQDVVHKLTPEIIARLETEAGDLTNLYSRPTSEEVARIVAESDLMTGRSRAVDEILDRKNDAVETTNNTDDTDDDSTDIAVTGYAAASTVPASQLSLGTTSKTEQGSATTSTGHSTTIQVDAPVTSKVQVPTVEMSDEDFLKSLGA